VEVKLISAFTNATTDDYEVGKLTGSGYDVRDVDITFLNPGPIRYFTHEHHERIVRVKEETLRITVIRALADYPHREDGVWYQGCVKAEAFSNGWVEIIRLPIKNGAVLATQIEWGVTSISDCLVIGHETFSPVCHEVIPMCMEILSPVGEEE
jgi:hypothetical protein